MTFQTPNAQVITPLGTESAGPEILFATGLNTDARFFGGFTTRHGGVSSGVYSSLNLGSHVGDDLGCVLENRRLVALASGFAPEGVVTAEQVHGARVAVVDGTANHIESADALVTNTPGVLLMLMFADCVPIVIVDPLEAVVAVVHSGWKGTKANIVNETVVAMESCFGGSPSNFKAAIGPSIGYDKYELSADVAEQFQEYNLLDDNCIATSVMTYNRTTGKYLLDLKQIVFQQLIRAGLRRESVSVSIQCTYSNQREFFSHRRDGIGGASTGRMAAIAGVRPIARSMENR